MITRQMQCLAILALILALAGCATTSPIRAAETTEQTAFAAYGTFTVYQELAGDIMRDTAVPDRVKLAIQRAEGKAKPIADSLSEAARELLRVRREYQAIMASEDGDGADRAQQRLLEAAEGVSRWITELEPAMADLIRAVGEV